jgi:hypothetical protein
MRFGHFLGYAFSNPIVVNIKIRNNLHVFLKKYLYLDEVDAKSSTSNLLDLLELAHLYAVPGLIYTCTEYLHNKISPGSCVEIYERTALFRKLPLRLRLTAFHEMRE